DATDDSEDNGTQDSEAVAITTVPIGARGSVPDSVVLAFEATAAVAGVAGRRISAQAAAAAVQPRNARLQWQTATTLASGAAQAASATATEARSGDVSVWT